MPFCAIFSISLINHIAVILHKYEHEQPMNLHPDPQLSTEFCSQTFEKFKIRWIIGTHNLLKAQTIMGWCLAQTFFKAKCKTIRGETMKLPIPFGSGEGIPPTSLGDGGFPPTPGPD